jgi:hypothetical protein
MPRIGPVPVMAKTRATIGARGTGRGRLAWPLVVLLCGAAVALIAAAMAG